MFCLATNQNIEMKISIQTAKEIDGVGSTVGCPNKRPSVQYISLGTDVYFLRILYIWHTL